MKDKIERAHVDGREMVEISRLKDEVVDGVADRQASIELLLDSRKHSIGHLVDSRLDVGLSSSSSGSGGRKRLDWSSTGAVLNSVERFLVGDPEWDNRRRIQSAG